MSVLLIALRLEVSEEAYLPLLHYSNKGSGCASKIDGSQATYAEVTANVKVHTPPSDDKTRYRGNRQLGEITIQTYTAKGKDMDVETSKYAPKPKEGKKAEKTTVEDSPETVTKAKEKPEGSEKKVTGETQKASIDEKNIADGSSDSTQKINTTKKSGREEATSKPKGSDNVKTDSSADSSSKNSAVKAGPSQERKGLKDSRSSKRSTAPHSKDQTKESGAARGKDGASNILPHARSQSPQSSSPTICYFSGNPSVEITEGIIHLYKENQMTSLTDSVNRSEMICMLSVPAKMTSAELLQFIAPVETWIESMKIIRDKTPNRYMVLVKFRSQKHADDFYTNFNNINYNSLEPDICHLAYVAKLETVKSSGEGSMPMAGHTELPVCPVCLERMDESVDGILTILCNHSFHSNCLGQWEDTTCPVCRYVQTPEAVEDHHCFECDSQDSLWICLICAHVGCGRYVAGHAFRHFLETQHTYSLQLGNNRVWDYAGDNYVHRLVQNKGDGKLVQVDEGGNIVQEEKLDSITLEYTYLLTNQLESQRRYFEEKIEHIEKEALVQVETVEAQSRAALEQCKKLEQNLAMSNKDKQVTEKKAHQMQAKLNKVMTDLTEEKELNRSLMKNQVQWQTKVTQLETAMGQKEKEIADVQEQLRDVMFYLEAQNKLATVTDVSKEEIADGQIIIGAAGGSTPNEKGKKGKKKGR